MDPPAGVRRLRHDGWCIRAAVPSVMIDFQDLYATVLGIEREEENGRYPERLPTQSYALPAAEAMRLRAIDVALDMELDVVVHQQQFGSDPA